MSGRRSEPAPIGPWYLRETPAERRLTRALRRDGDRWVVGADPWAVCDTCGLVRDTSEFFSCPGCAAYTAARARERAARAALERLDVTTMTH